MSADGEMSELRPIAIRSLRRTYQVTFVPSAVDSLRYAQTDRDYAVVDRAVADRWPNFLSALSSDRIVLVSADESTKSLEGVESLLDGLVERGITRRDRLLVIGGGIVQDVSSFAASVLFRGLDWVFYPTTLLAQADSCIGGKTSLNFKHLKNQLGGFHPPAEIVIGSDVRQTLSPQDLASGYGEIAHYLLLSSEDDFALLERVMSQGADAAAISMLVHRSLSIKRPYVERDEFDTGERRLLNFGHTFGHALETATHNRLPHGIAVAFGIDLANVVSCHRGLLDPTLRNRIRRTLAVIWSDHSIAEVTPQAMVDALRRDKKGDRTIARPILTGGFGAMVEVPMSVDGDLRPLLDAYLLEGVHLRDL